MSEFLCNQILKYRSHEGYESIANVRGVNNSISLTKTPQSVLNKRSELIESTRGLQIETSIAMNLQLTFTNPMVFRSLWNCIMPNIPTTINQRSKPSPVQGEQLTTPFMYDDCKTWDYMSPNLGMDKPCNILLYTEFHWVELYEDQSINPIVHLDSCCVLDQIVEQQFATLLSYYN